MMREVIAKVTNLGQRLAHTTVGACHNIHPSLEVFGYVLFGELGLGWKELRPRELLAGTPHCGCQAGFVAARELDKKVGLRTEQQASSTTRVRHN